MAIKRQQTNPVIQLDCVVTGVERDLKRVYADNVPTGELEDAGRKLAVVTAQGSPDLEVKVPNEFDEIPFEPGQRVLINAEYSEFSPERGRTISTMRFHSFVNPGQLDAWQGIVKAQARVAQPA